VVLLWGNGAFPGGSIGERVLRGPARKGHTPPQRARRDAPKPATPSTASNNTPPFHPPPSSTFVPQVLTRVRCVPRRCFPSPTHTHTHRGEACRGPPGAVARHRHPIPATCGRGKWVSGVAGAVARVVLLGNAPFPGDPSVSVFCVGLPEKGTRQCRERGGTPPRWSRLRLSAGAGFT